MRGTIAYFLFRPVCLELRWYLPCVIVLNGDRRGDRQYLLCGLLKVRPQWTGFTHDVRVKRVSVHVTVGVTDFTGTFTDVSLSAENNHAIFPSYALPYRPWGPPSLL